MEQRAFFVPLPLVSDKFRLCALVREHRRTGQREKVVYFSQNHLKNVLKGGKLRFS